MVDWVQLALGAFVLWAPGLAWTWALAPDLDWAQFLTVSVITAASIQPAVMYTLNLFLGVAVSPMNVILLSLALTSLGLALAIRPRLEAQWS